MKKADESVGKSREAMDTVPVDELSPDVPSSQAGGGRQPDGETFHWLMKLGFLVAGSGPVAIVLMVAVFAASPGCLKTISNQLTGGCHFLGVMPADFLLGVLLIASWCTVITLPAGLLICLVGSFAGKAS
jgi:hypothetical protein